jgi:hypothetical protein
LVVRGSRAKSAIAYAQAPSPWRRATLIAPSAMTSATSPACTTRLRGGDVGRVCLQERRGDAANFVGAAGGEGLRAEHEHRTVGEERRDRVSVPRDECILEQVIELLRRARSRLHRMPTLRRGAGDAYSRNLVFS